jgi:membrane-associated phospholipid phosphatase
VLVRLGQEVQALPRRLTRAAYLLVFALTGLVLLWLAYPHDPLAVVDREVSEWVASSLPEPFEWIARPLSWLGGWIGLTLLGVLASVALVRERAWLDLAFFLTAYVGSQLATLLVKAIVDRPRPALGSAVPLPESSAFPSGHATAGAASLGALAVLVSERLPSRRARTWLWVVVVVLGLGIGLSRIALNVHFVTDVLAGWCFGLAWLAACLLGRDFVRGRAASRSR